MKLTITLSGRALDTLNHLMESSGFGSRGRTIEEAILAVDDLTRLGDQLLPLIVQTSQKPSQEQAVSMINTMNSFIVYYIATTSRFRKPIRPPASLSPPSVPDAKTIGGRQQG